MAKSGRSSMARSTVADGFVAASLLTPGDAQVIAGFGIVRIDTHGALASRDGRVQLSLQLQNVADRRVRRTMIGNRAPAPLHTR